MKRLKMAFPLLLMFLTAVSAADKKALLVIESSTPKFGMEKVREFKALCAGKLSAGLVSVIDWDEAVAESEREAVSRDSSVLAKARQLQAPLIIKVTLSDLSETVKTIGRSGQHDLAGAVSLLTLSSSVKVSHSADGSSIYGGVVSTVDRIAVSKTLKIKKSNRLYGLFNQLAENVAKIVTSKWGEKFDGKLDHSTVAFTVKTNVPGVTVKLDGMVAPQQNGMLKAAKGIHKLRVEREWFKPFEGTVFVSDGGTIDLSLELSAEGIAKYKTIERFEKIELKAAEALIGIAKEQSGAEATRKVLEAEGKKQFLENSKVSIDGEINELNIDVNREDERDDAVNQIINVTK